LRSPGNEGLPRDGFEEDCARFLPSSAYSNSALKRNLTFLWFHGHFQESSKSQQKKPRQRKAM
jgi:hypothetical protein